MQRQVPKLFTALKLWQLNDTCRLHTFAARLLYQLDARACERQGLCSASRKTLSLGQGHEKHRSGMRQLPN